MRSKPSRALRGAPATLVLLAFVVASLYPIAFMLASSLRTDQDYSSGAARPPASFRPLNYVEAWNKGKIATLGLNSIVITAASILACAILGAMCAYAIEKVLGKRSGKALYAFVVAGLIIPIQVLMIPLFKVLQQLAMINTFHGIILVYVALNLAFSVFVFSGFMRGVPNEILEAARIDGSSILGSFWRIVFPMSRTAVATVAILVGMAVWKDMTVPLVYITNPALKTLPIGLFYFRNEYSFSAPVLMAAMVIQTLPLVVAFVLLQKSFVRGVAEGAVKG